MNKLQKIWIITELIPYEFSPAKITPCLTLSSVFQYLLSNYDNLSVDLSDRNAVIDDKGNKHFIFCKCNSYQFGSDMEIQVDEVEIYQ